MSAFADLLQCRRLVSRFIATKLDKLGLVIDSKQFSKIWLVTGYRLETKIHFTLLTPLS